jgi:ClpP class serine protease
MSLTSIFWIFIILVLVLPILQRKLLESRRLGAMRAIERRRKSRVIAMVHRQETMSLLGFPIMRYIDINDAEEVMRAVRLTADDVPIDFIIHTPGGLVLPTDQIASALLRHPSKVTVFVPHYAMSGGTLIALAADEIVMAPNAVLGPIDPQVGGMPAASIIKVTELKRAGQMDDQTLIMADVAQKALEQLRERVKSILVRHMEIHAADELAVKLTKGTWTHDYAITFEQAKELGFAVSAEMPAEIYQFMSYFPQAKRSEPSVQYVPVPYRREAGGEAEKGAKGD